MTIDVTIPRETSSLIEPSTGRYFPLRIPPHQLKNLISTTEPDIVYYISKYDIYALHLATRKRELLTTLPWKPCSLGTGYGWICAGGTEKGRCAFINLRPKKEDDDRPNTLRAEVDARLPVHLRGRSSFSELWRLDNSDDVRHARPDIQIHEVGESIVNSITVHWLCDNQTGEEGEAVAILANNDKTVRIWALADRRERDKILFPTWMNHASISPDGKLLVAVGDEPRAFFCKRDCTQASWGPWSWFAEPRLIDVDPKDACFSTAFSPSGHICAVASQTGVITVYDTSKIHEDMEDDDAIIDVLRSSRMVHTTDLSGAVRSMSFAPSPLDLLVWGEDQGRVCVIDLRDGFRSRQTIELETDSPGVHMVDTIAVERDTRTAEQRELEIEARFIQRQQEALDAQDHFAAVTHAADYLELTRLRRRQERESRERGENHDRESSPHALSESERQILASIGRQRMNEQASQPAQPASFNAHASFSTIATTRAELQRLEEQFEQSHADNARWNPSRGQSVNYTIPQNISDRQSAIPIPSLTQNAPSHNPTRSTSSIHDYMRQRNLERTTRTTDRSYQPRRRSSIVVSSGNNQITSSHSTSLVPIGTAIPTLSASPSRLPTTVADAPANVASSTATPLATNSLPVTSNTNTSTNSSIDPWQTISEAMFRGNTSSETNTSRFRRERELRAQEERQQTVRLERQRTQRLRELRERMVGRVNGEGIYEDYELHMLRRLTEGLGGGVGVTGVGWSVDGRNLYVGTEEGIFEYAVNIRNRKTFPSISLQ